SQGARPSSAPLKASETRASTDMSSDAIAGPSARVSARTFGAGDALLLALLQGHRSAKDPEPMMQAAAAALGEHLEVDRVGFFEKLDAGTLCFGAGWSAGRLPLLTGTFPFAGIGRLCLAEVEAGLT